MKPLNSAVLHLLGLLVIIFVLLQSVVAYLPAEQSTEILAFSYGFDCIPGPIKLDKISFIGSGFYSPQIEPDGKIVVADPLSNKVFTLNEQLYLIPMAGKSLINETSGKVINCRNPGYSGDDGVATEAQLNNCIHISHAFGKYFITDARNYVIRKVSFGVIDTVAGTGKNADRMQDFVDASLAVETPLLNPIKTKLVGDELFILEERGILVVRNGLIYHYLDPKYRFPTSSNVTILTFDTISEGYYLILSIVVDYANYIYRYGKDNSWKLLVETDFKNRNDTLVYVKELVSTNADTFYFIETYVPLNSNPLAYSSIKRYETDGTITQFIPSTKKGVTFFGLGASLDGRTIIYSQDEDDLKQFLRVKLSCKEMYALSNDRKWCLPTCDGLSKENPDVCNKHGSCIGVNKCLCDEGYDQYEYHYCGLPVCWGSTNLTGGCSGHGICQHPNQCLCDDGYDGPQCQYFKCNGTSQNNVTTVCSGRGICDGINKCNCFQDEGSEMYGGMNCELSICGNKWSIDEEVCNGHGICVDYNKCECGIGYDGPNCDINWIMITVIVVICILIALFFSIIIFCCWRMERSKHRNTQDKLEEISKKIAKYEQKKQEALVTPRNSISNPTPLVGYVQVTHKNKTYSFDLDQFFKTDQHYFVKRVNQNYTDLMSAFENYRLIYQNASPTLVRIEEIYFINEELFIIMKLYTPTKNYKPTCKTKMIKAIQSMAKSLKELHSRKKIIHRDISYKNYVVDSDGNFVLIDFDNSWKIETVEFRKWQKEKQQKEQDLEDEEEEGGVTHVSPTHPDSILGDLYALGFCYNYLLENSYLNDNNYNFTEEDILLRDKLRCLINNLLNHEIAPNYLDEEYLKELVCFSIDSAQSQENYYIPTNSHTDRLDVGDYKTEEDKILLSTVV